MIVVRMILHEISLGCDGLASNHYSPLGHEFLKVSLRDNTVSTLERAEDEDKCIVSFRSSIQISSIRGSGVRISVHVTTILSPWFLLSRSSCPLGALCHVSPLLTTDRRKHSISEELVGMTRQEPIGSPNGQPSTAL